jgi:transcriptional regulator with XRE-family HTH domain
MTAVERLAAFLESKGWTIADLARAAELDHSTVSKILSGKRSAGLAAAAAFERVTEREAWGPGPIRAEEWVHEVPSPKSTPVIGTFPSPEEAEAIATKGAA